MAYAARRLTSPSRHWLSCAGVGAFLSSVLLVLGGCLYTPVDIPLPRFGPEGVPTDGAGRRVIVVRAFRDQRVVRDRIGAKKNDLDWETAPVRATEDPCAWLADQLAEMLHAAGFVVVQANEDPSLDALRIEGDLRLFFVEDAPEGVEADLHVHLVATTPSGQRAERDFYAKGVGEWHQWRLDVLYREAVQKAALETLRNMTTAILELYGLLPATAFSRSNN